MNKVIPSLPKENLPLNSMATIEQTIRKGAAIIERFLLNDFFSFFLVALFVILECTNLYIHSKAITYISAGIAIIASLITSILIYRRLRN